MEECRSKCTTLTRHLSQVAAPARPGKQPLTAAMSLAAVVAAAAVPAPLAPAWALTRQPAALLAARQQRHADLAAALGHAVGQEELAAKHGNGANNHCKGAAGWRRRGSSRQLS